MPSFTSLILKNVPARIADLEFEVNIPEQWTVAVLPPADDDFSDPGLFLPLLVVVAPFSPVVLAISARPAYENGTILDWVPYLIEQQGFQPIAMGPALLGALKATAGMARQPQADDGPRHVRFVFFEDGGRLVNMVLTAPEKVARELEDVWQGAMNSFKLARPKGQGAHP